MPVIPPASLSLSFFFRIPFCRSASNIRKQRIPAQLFEYGEKFRTVTSTLLFVIHSTEKKNKNNRKVTKLPTAKLIEIAFANCKKNVTL